MANTSRARDFEHRVQAELIAAERRGEIRRPYSCSRCRYFPSARMGIQAHHYDYRLPLDVEWLCIKCHEAEHRRLRSLNLSIPAPYSPTVKARDLAY